MLKYSILIQYDDRDDIYVASIPELPGCMADGKSKIEVLQNIEVIIDEWIETAKMLNRPIPEPSYIPLHAENNQNTTLRHGIYTN